MKMKEEWNEKINKMNKWNERINEQHRQTINEWSNQINK